MKKIIFLLACAPFFAQAKTETPVQIQAPKSIADCSHLLPKGQYDMSIALNIASPQQTEKNPISFNITDGSKTLNKETLNKLWPFVQCVSPLINNSEAVLENK